MARIVMTIKGDGLRRFHDAVKTLGSARKAERAFVRAINRTGEVGGNEAGRALSDQTGLRKATGKKAYRRKVDRAQPGKLSYEIQGSGGEISLKHFKPRETRKGVSAAPMGQRQIYPHTFMKAGWWPSRVDKPGWNRQVFSRVDDGHGYTARKSDPRVISGAMKRERKGTAFRKEKSGVLIPIEMLRGKAAAAFLTTGPRLEARIAHEITAITKGVVSGSGRRKR